jgi:serine/threonine-protein kinase
MSSTPPNKSVDLPEGLPVAGELLAGKYRVERTLGVGGMGVVVAARHIELDERVAVKFLLPHVPPHGEPVARFIREARAASKIKSEHVVRVYDVGRLENGAPYIVMEYLDGCDLAQLVDRHGPLSVHDAVSYVMQACEALASAHALGIVHRDLKPANLFLTTSADGTPKLKVLDFGISKISQSDGESDGSYGLTSTATIMGTPSFMSPEQLRSTRDVDGRADIWSLGAILYALLAGTPPYEGESNADVSAKIIRDDPPPLRSVRPDASEAMEKIVQKCLAKKAANRYADVSELANALAEVGNDGAKSAAVRVARVATAIAPTLRSNAPPPVVPKAGSTPDARTPTTDNPTRTASSWGESKPPAEETKRRAIPLGAILFIAAAIAALAALGISRVDAPSAPAAAPPPTIPIPIATSIATSPSPSPSPSSSSSPTTSPSPSITASARVVPSAKPPASAPPAPSASAPPKKSLFEDRE